MRMSVRLKYLNYRFAVKFCSDIHGPQSMNHNGSKLIFMLQVYFLTFYNGCALGCECCQKARDLNASCLDTDGALKLLLLC